jgi:hypothetical protein
MNSQFRMEPNDCSSVISDHSFSSASSGVGDEADTNNNVSKHRKRGSLNNAQQICSGEITLDMIEKFLNPLGKRDNNPKHKNLEYNIMTASDGLGLMKIHPEVVASSDMRRETSLSSINSASTMFGNVEKRSDRLPGRLRNEDEEFAYLDLKKEFEIELSNQENRGNLNKSIVIKFRTSIFFKMLNKRHVIGTERHCTSFIFIE